MDDFQEILQVSCFAPKIIGKIFNNDNKELSFQLVSSQLFDGKTENFDVKIMINLNNLQVRFMTTRLEFPSLLMKNPRILNHLNSRLNLGTLRYRFQRKLIFYSFVFDFSCLDKNPHELFLELFTKVSLIFESEVQKIFECDKNKDFTYNRKLLNPRSFQPTTCLDCKLSTSDCPCSNFLKEGDFNVQNFPEILEELEHLSFFRDFFDLDSGFFDPETFEYAYNPCNLLSNSLKKFQISEGFNQKLLEMFEIMEKNSIFFKSFPAELLVVTVNNQQIVDFRLALVFEQVYHFKRLFTSQNPGNYLNDMRVAYEILILHSINMKDVLEEDFIDQSSFSFPDLDKQPKIGSGGFGRVYKNELNGRTVAIKIQEQKKNYSLILNEFGILRRFHNRFIVKTFGLVRYKHKNCLVMPFVDGGSLKDLSHNKLELLDSLNIMKNVAKGLAYVHRFQVIHQDIKPQNILLGPFNTVENEEINPVIIDFGLAVNLWNRKNFRGFTWEYSDPDQIDNKSPGIEADIWSYGMTFYWVLFRKNPFGRSYRKKKSQGHPQNQARIIHKMIKSQGLRPEVDSKFEEDYPKIIQILKDCWKVNPKDRPTAIEIYKRLEEIIETLEDFV